MRDREYFDIKIASDTPSRDLKKQSGGGDVFTQALKEQASGSLRQARRFGCEMADRMLRAGARMTFGEQDPVLSLQYKVLFAFCVAAGLELYSGSSFVFRAALNAFYDCLREKHRELYEELDSTGAFSFYYLAFRKSGDNPDEIGAVFSMLCGADGDKALCEKGKSLYVRFMRYVVGQMRAAKIFGEVSAE